MRSTSNGDVAADVDEHAAAGPWWSTFRSKSSNDIHRSVRLQSTNSTRAPAAWIASGVAMNVFDGQRTTRPRTSKNSSAASAAPVQLDIDTAGRPFHVSHALEAARQRPARPLLTVEHPVPEPVQARAVAVVEADGEGLYFQGR